MQIEPAPGFLKYPDHSVEIAQAENGYELFFHGVCLASSQKVLQLSENGYPARFYFPFSDIQMNRLLESKHTSYCPFKGQARYWNLQSSAGDLENGAWAYDQPYLECLELAQHICFYADKPGITLKVIHD